MKKELIFLILIVFIISGCNNIKDLSRESPEVVKQVNLEGRVYLIQYDDFENPENSKLSWFIQTEDNFFELEDKNILDNLVPGSKVQVNGLLKNNNIEISDLGLNVLGEVPQTPGPDFNLGENPTLILIGEYDDLPATFSIEDLESLIFLGNESVDDFYKENSYGQSWLSGEIVGPINLGERHSLYNCSINHSSIISAGDDLLRTSDSLVNFTKYKRIILLFDNTNLQNCGGGLAEVGASTHDTSDGEVNQTLTWVLTHFFEGFSPKAIFSHEIGHNFGAFHSSFVDCNSSSFGAVNISSCNNIEYGNIYSIMGGGGNRHFSSHHKRIFGWFNDNNYMVVNYSGTYNILPLENYSGIKEIIIPYGRLSGTEINFTWGWVPSRVIYTYYSIDFRLPIGYDSEGHYFSVNDGIFLKFLSKNSEMFWHSEHEHLIDSKPISGEYVFPQSDAAMLTGDEYQDNNIGLKIKVINMTNESASIRIDYFNPECPLNTRPNICNPGFETDEEFQEAHFIGSVVNEFNGNINKWAITPENQRGSNFANKYLGVGYNSDYSLGVADQNTDKPISITYFTEASAGKTYSCSAYARNAIVENQVTTENWGDGYQDLAMWFFDENKVKISSETYTNNCDISDVCETARSTTWMKYTLTRKAPANTKYVECFVNSMIQDRGITFWDDFEIKEVITGGSSPLILKDKPRNVATVLE